MLCRWPDEECLNGCRPVKIKERRLTSKITYCECMFPVTTFLVCADCGYKCTKQRIFLARKQRERTQRKEG